MAVLLDFTSDPLILVSAVTFLFVRNWNMYVYLSHPIVVSSSTAALTSSPRTLSTTLQPVSTSKAPQLSSAVAIISSARTLLSTLQPVLTSKAPQPTYLSTLHFHTLHTVLPSSSHYKPTISPEPAGSITPEFSSSVIPTSSASSEHTTVYQTASVPTYTPSVSPTPPQPVAGVSVQVTPCYMHWAALYVCKVKNLYDVSFGEKENSVIQLPVNQVCVHISSFIFS